MITWQETVEGYWLEKRRDLSPHTVADYRVTFARFGAHIGEQTPVDAITAADRAPLPTPRTWSRSSCSARPRPSTSSPT